MFWNNHRFWRTVKFRIAAFYAGVFAVSSLIAFLLVYWFQYSFQIRATDLKLNDFLNGFEFEYLTGGELRPTYRVLKLDAVPGPVVSAISQKIPGLKPLFAYVDSTAKEKKYFLLGRSAVSLYLFEVDSKTLAVTVRGMPEAQRIASLEREFNGESYGEERNQIFFLLFSGGGKVLARSPFRDKYLPLFRSALTLPHDGNTWIVTVKEHKKKVRLVGKRLFDGNILLIGSDLKRINGNMRILAVLFCVFECFMLLAGALSGWLLAKRFTHGVDRVRHTATMIAAGDFSLRVAHGGEGEEIDNLVDSFNTMTRNTEQLLRELKAISDDIAHDLRTPITRLRGMAELAISQGRDSELAYDVAEECCNMLGMINTMLEITKTESGIQAEPSSLLNLSEQLANIVDLFSSVAEDKRIDLRLNLPDAPVFFRCGRIRFQRAIANLLDNALKFTPENGSVTVSLRKDLASLTLTVEDTGCGIGFEDQKHIFERFYRADSSRSLPGNGLGLSLADAIVKSYHGTLRLKSSPGGGSCFTITFPAESCPL